MLNDDGNNDENDGGYKKKTKPIAHKHIENLNHVDLTPSQLEKYMSTISSDSFMDTIATYLSDPQNIIKTNDASMDGQIGIIMDKVLRIRMRTKLVNEKIISLSNEELDNITNVDYDKIIEDDTEDEERLKIYDSKKSSNP